MRTTLNHFDQNQDAPLLKELAEHDVFIGTSSWIYEGWRGQVYRGDYSGKKKDFIKSRFKDECLAEYSAIFPTVCFDGAYYRLPTPEQLQAYAAGVPDDFRLALKTTDSITLRRSRSYEKGKMVDGGANPLFLNQEAFVRGFLEPMKESLGEKLGPVILEFSPFGFSKQFGYKDGYTPLQFVKDLHQFLSGVPNDINLGVEVRDPEFLDAEFPHYLDCLRNHGVSHVINQQTWMPPIHEQLRHPNILTAEHTIVRALVRPGVTHEAAVREFTPYDRTQMVLPEMRQALAELIRRSIAGRRGLYIYINNRTEGNAPNTIAGVLDLFEQE